MRLAALSRLPNVRTLRLTIAVVAVVLVVAVIGIVIAVRSSGSKPSAAPSTRPSLSIGPTDTGAVHGVVYRDSNGDGVRDPGEPGVAGIRIRDKKGDLSTLTAADGSYSFATVPDKGFLQLETGWFRSQCPPVDQPTAMSCPADSAAGDGYAVNNQFIQYALTGVDPTSPVDVGLVPDWPGSSAAAMVEPAPVNGTIPANAVDVAARLSWASGDCAGDDYAICTTGSRFSMAAQVYNQGTTALTGIRGRVYVPPGDCATGVTLLPYTVPAGLGAMTVTPSRLTCDTRYVDVSFAGSLVPAAGVRVSVAGETRSGPGTPGCRPEDIDTSLCPIDEPQSRGWLFGISHIDQTGDPDSTFCAAGDMTTCPIGLHDKRRAPDEIDPAGHTVNAALGGTTAYDLHAHVRALGPGGAGPTTATAGADVTLRAWVTNRVASGATNASPEHVLVKVYLPAGVTIVGVPPRHRLLGCDQGVRSANATVITCDLGGPVAPTLSSPAIDVTVTVPATWAPTTPFRAVVCAVPPAGDTEAGPAATSCGASTDVDGTSSNNDADHAWTISP